MTSVRHLIAKALVPPMHCLLLFLVRINNYQKLSIGRTTFYGPECFVELCRHAAYKLQDIDGAVFTAITTRRYVFWYDRQRPVHFDQHYAINQGSCAWKAHGIIAFLVYAHYRSCREASNMPLSALARTQSLAREIRQQTLFWLLKNDFPAELVSYYAQD